MLLPPQPSKPVAVDIGSARALQEVFDSFERKPLTMRSLEKLLPNEASCSEFLLALRTRSLPLCPSSKVHHNWVAETRWRYRCRRCCATVSPKANCLFHKTRVPVAYWFSALLLSLFSTTGVSSHLVSRHLAIELASAFRILRHWRKQIASLANDEKLGGPGRVVEIDETFITQTRGSLARDPVVFGIKEGARVWTTVVANRERSTLWPIIDKMVAKGTTIHSDQWPAYQGLATRGYHHLWVNHSKGVFSSQGVSTTGIDAYWSYLKRALRTVFRSILPENLPDYLKDAEVRFNYNHDPRRLFNDVLLSVPQARLT